MCSIEVSTFQYGGQPREIQTIVDEVNNNENEFWDALDVFYLR